MENRCDWAKGELYEQYHDTEWGRQEHDDQKLFEFLILEGMQAGLTWLLILKRRENMREAFDGFDPVKIAQYDEAKQQELLQNPGIIRNRLKVKALVGNAQAFLAVQKEFGSFDRYIWQFTGGKTLQHCLETTADTPATSPESDAMSKDLKKRGFRFVGSTICYSFMQAAGMVNDHAKTCPCYAECGGI